MRIARLTLVESCSYPTDLLMAETTLSLYIGFGITTMKITASVRQWKTWTVSRQDSQFRVACWECGPEIPSTTLQCAICFGQDAGSAVLYPNSVVQGKPLPHANYSGEILRPEPFLSIEDRHRIFTLSCTGVRGLLRSKHLCYQLDLILYVAQSVGCDGLSKPNLRSSGQKAQRPGYPLGTTLHMHGVAPSQLFGGSTRRAR